MFRSIFCSVFLTSVYIQLSICDVVVQTKYGKLQGRITQYSRAFLGVPYAKPPVGPLRYFRQCHYPSVQTLFQSSTSHFMYIHVYYLVFPLYQPQYVCLCVCLSHFYQVIYSSEIKEDTDINYIYTCILSPSSFSF